MQKMRLGKGSGRRNGKSSVFYWGAGPRLRRGAARGGDILIYSGLLGSSWRCSLTQLDFVHFSTRILAFPFHFGLPGTIFDGFSMMIFGGLN